MTALLGEILCLRGLLSKEQRDQALALSKKLFSRLGEVVVTKGWLNYQQIYQAIATQHDLPYVDLLKDPPETALLDAEDADFYIQFKLIPYKKQDNRYIIATSEYNDTTITIARQHYGEEAEFVITSPKDIHEILRRQFAGYLTEQSTLQLYKQAAWQSAKRQPASISFIIWLALCMAVVGWFVAYPDNGMFVLLLTCHILYSVTMGFKLWIYLAGLKKQNLRGLPSLLQEEDLPIYTILIPMYREVASLPDALNAMASLDYPMTKLDIKLVLEADDEETYAAALALKPPANVEIIRVPASNPRTKPKACNYALRFARGEYVTVYDADDRPEPQQLRKALAAFMAASKEVVCLQARLNYYNAHDNWLTRLFSLEYAMLFHVLLHGLFRLNMPILLGGTSNHIALARLREIGEWDPHNVTEDADLGTRLAVRGYKTMMIDSDTLEEAPNSLSAWLKQRTRWIKGYMQTWLVHMRRPLTLYQGLGFYGFFGFQCFVALSSFSYLTAPLAWTVFIIWWSQAAALLPAWLYDLAIINLVANIAIHLFTAVHVTRIYGKNRRLMVFTSLLYPFYLILHSIASYIALWQLIVKPYVWNKTEHGKAKTNVDFLLTTRVQAV